MEQALFAIYAVLFAALFFALVVHYRRLRQGSKEYSEAKTVLDDIVLSFSKDLRQQEGKIRDVALQSDRLASENQKVAQRMDSQIAEIRTELGTLRQSEHDLHSNYDALKKEFADLMSQQAGILRKLGELGPFEGAATPTQAATELPVPIRRDRALAPLTETEMRILELLASEGERTAPRIRQVVGLSREHTTRLMKKLLLQGYVERRTDTTPYSYRLKKEMRDLLKSQDSET